LSEKTKGFFAILSSSALYGLYGIYSRFIADGFQTFSQGWVRGFVVCVLLGFYLKNSNQGWKKFKKPHLKWLIPWSLLSPIIVLFSFIAYVNLPISTVYFLLYSTMTAGGFLSGKIFFKERISLIKIVSLLLIFLAIYLIYSFSIETSQATFALFALIAGLATGFWNTLSKKISSSYCTFQLAFVDAFVCFVICLLLSLYFKEPLPELTPTEPWLWILIFSITTVVTVNLLIYGFRQIEAQLGTIIMPLQIIFGAFFGWLILSESISLNTALGGILIFAAAILPNIYQTFCQKHFKKRPRLLRTPLSKT
jgi:drug/metabolite transporter (DMT)-like permease